MYDVVIVGAGLAGLYTARCLEKEGLSFLVVEARDYVGGRAYTLRDGSSYTDLGGGYYAKAHSYVMDLARQLGVQFYKLPSGGKITILLAGNKRIYFNQIDQSFDDRNINQDFCRVMKMVDECSKQVPITEPWKAPKAAEWDKKTLQEFVEENCSSRESAVPILMLSSFIYGDPAAASLLFCLHFTRVNGGTRTLISNSHYGFQEMKITTGSNSLSERMADQLGKSVVLNTEIISVLKTASGYQLLSKDGREFQCKTAVMAVCPMVLRNIAFTPAFPQDVQEYINYDACDGAYYKICSYYKKPFWREKGIRPELISEEGIVAVCLEDTKPDGSNASITGFIDGAVYDKLSQAERKQRVSDYYAEVFGVEEFRHPVKYVEKYWGDEDTKRFSGVCVWCCAPNFLTTTKRMWGEKIGKLFFASTEASRLYTGYMEGCLRSGEHTALQVMTALDIKPRYHQGSSLVAPPFLNWPNSAKL